MRRFFLFILSFVCTDVFAYIDLANNLDLNQYYRIIHQKLDGQGLPAYLSMTKKLALEFQQARDESEDSSHQYWKIVKDVEFLSCYHLINHFSLDYLMVGESGSLKLTPFASLRGCFKFRKKTNGSQDLVIKYDRLDGGSSDKYIGNRNYSPFEPVLQEHENEDVYFQIVSDQDILENINSQENSAQQRNRGAISSFFESRPYYRVSLLGDRTGLFNSALGVSRSNFELVLYTPSDINAVGERGLERVNDMKTPLDLWYMDILDHSEGSVRLRNVSTELFLSIENDKCFPFVKHLQLESSDASNWLMYLTPLKQVGVSETADQSCLIYFTHKLRPGERYFLYATKGGLKVVQDESKASLFRISPATDYDKVRQRHFELLCSRSFAWSTIQRLEAYLELADKFVELRSLYQNKINEFNRTNLIGSGLGSTGSLAGTVGTTLAVFTTGPVAPVLVATGVGTGLLGSVISLTNLVIKTSYEQNCRKRIQALLDQISLTDQGFYSHVNLVVSRGMEHPGKLNNLLGCSVENPALNRMVCKLALNRSSGLFRLHKHLRNALFELIKIENLDFIVDEVGEPAIYEVWDLMKEEIARDMSTRFVGVSSDMVKNTFGIGVSSVFTLFRISTFIKASGDLFNKKPGFATRYMNTTLGLIFHSMHEMQNMVLAFPEEDLSAEELRVFKSQVQRMDKISAQFVSDL